MPDRRSALTKAREEAEQAKAEEERIGVLDDPRQAGKGDPARQIAYLSGMVIFGFLLNLAILIVISGGK
jgi:hypothetical protein